MDGIVGFLEKYFMPFAGRMAQQRHLQAMRDGIIASMPLLLIGSVFLMIGFLPIKALEEAVKPYLPNLLIVVNATFGIMSLVVAYATAYSLAGHYKLDGLSAGVLSVSSFLMVIPLAKTGGVDTSWFGSKGVFVVLILAMLAVEIQRFIVNKKIIIKMPAGTPPAVARSFEALIPGLVIIVVVWGIVLSCKSMFGISFPEVINKIIAAPLLSLGGTLPATLFAIVVIHLLWSFGIHGGSIVYGIMGPIWLSFTEQNAAAAAAGQALPNVIVNQFLDAFVHLGGSGATLALVILMVVKARSKQTKTLGKAAIWPAFFNINEPIIFGMPIMMNPLLIIPFILAPLVCATTSYFAMSSGLVPKLYILAPWTAPIIASGFITSGGSINAVLLQVVNLVIAMLIYYPFFQLWDRQKVKEEA